MTSVFRLMRAIVADEHKF